MIFLTGGTGFLGRNLIQHLCEQNYPVRALVRQPAEHLWLNDYPVEVVAGDVLDRRGLANAMQGCTSVIHAAGLFRMWGEASIFHQVNLEGTTNVAEAAITAEVKRFIYISTVAVAGNPVTEQIIDETYPPAPADAYQRSKLAAEQVIQRMTAERGLPAIILRPGAYYGPHGHYAFNRLFFEDPMKGLLIKVDGGKRVIFPVYIEDVARASVLAIQRGRTGEIYNVTGSPLTHNQANDMVSEAAGIPRFRVNAPKWGMIALAAVWTWLSRFTQAEPYYPLNLRSYVFNDWHVSNTKACDELGFAPTPFRIGVQQTVAWYRARTNKHGTKLEHAKPIQIHWENYGS